MPDRVTAAAMAAIAVLHVRREVVALRDHSMAAVIDLLATQTALGIGIGPDSPISDLSVIETGTRIGIGAGSASLATTGIGIITITTTAAVLSFSTLVSRSGAGGVTRTMTPAITRMDLPTVTGADIMAATITT